MEAKQNRYYDLERLLTRKTDFATEDFQPSPEVSAITTIK
jgi:hypothetical protein